MRKMNGALRLHRKRQEDKLISDAIHATILTVIVPAVAMFGLLQTIIEGALL